MGMSKSDMHRRESGLKARLEQLEKEAKNDPLMRNRKLHEEIAEIKKKLASN